MKNFVFHLEFYLYIYIYKSIPQKWIGFKNI